MPRKPTGPEEMLVARLRAGDEMSFAKLVDELHGKLLALARTFTHSPALAEDIVQETWLAAIRGLPGFEERASLRTWLFSILVRRARTLAAREARTGTTHSSGDAGPTGNGAGRDPNVEWEPGRGRVGLWEGTPVPWPFEDPAALYESGEALEVVGAALDSLPESQRQIVLLRDVEGLSAEEACNILELSETNQRVLLHRGRARIRRALDRYVREGLRPPTPATAGPSPRGGDK